MKNVNYKIQVLQEQYAQDESNITFSEFVKLTSESDPGFSAGFSMMTNFQILMKESTPKNGKTYWQT